MGKKSQFLVVFCCLFLFVATEALAKKPPKPPPSGDGPSAPTGLTATLAYPDVLLDWNTNSETNVVGYNVYRSLFSKRKYNKINTGLVPESSYVDVPPTMETTYYYRVTAINSLDLESRNSDSISVYYFDNTPPMISGVDSLDVNENSVRIVWITDESSTSQVEYGTDSSYGQLTPVDPAQVTNHSVSLSGLLNDTLYHYRVRSTDAGGNETVSGDYTFSTPDLTPPVISAVDAVDISENSTQITWLTDEPATSQVDYAFCQTPTGSYSVTDPQYITDHSLILVNLELGIEYCYQVTSTDQSDNTSVSSEYSFQTLFDVAFCLSCHDGSDPAASYVGDFLLEGHGKTGVNLTCSDCHVNHLVDPNEYKHLKTLDAFWYPSPYISWQIAMQAQRDYCSYACHVDPSILEGSHPTADDPIMRWPEKPYVNFQDPTASFLPGDDMPLLDADQNYVQSLSDIVMCISCHNPHGIAGLPIMLRASDGVDLIPLCDKCHFYE
jgi:fibronectin type 3 domain-containing protein